MLALSAAGCGKISDGAQLDDPVCLSAVNVTAAGFSSAETDAVATRASDTGYGTAFVEGDRIGITVVQDGTILQDNVAYELTGGTWRPQGGGVYSYTHATYIAYYPYSDAMDGKKSADEIKAAFSPANDQSAYPAYTASDLMVWSGGASGAGPDKVLDIVMEHALSLLVINPPGAALVAPDEAGYVYHDQAFYPATNVAIEIVVNGVKWTPYAMQAGGGNTSGSGATTDAPDGTYRLIVPAGADLAVDVKYKAGNGNFSWNSGDNGGEPPTLAAGECLVYNIPGQFESRRPAIGDYLYPNYKETGRNALLPGDKTPEPGYCGVVFHVNNNPEKPFSGLVIGTAETTSAWSAEGALIGASDWNDGEANHALGRDAGCAAFIWVRDLAAAPPSGYHWYLPAVGELNFLHTALDPSLEASLDREGNGIKDKSYWSSTEQTGADAYSVTMSGGDMMNPVAKSTDLYVRAISKF